MVTAEEIRELLQEARDAWSFSDGDLAARAELDLEDLRAALQGAGDASDLGAVVGALGGTLDDLLARRPFWRAPAVAFKSAPTNVEAPLVRTALLRVSVAARDLEGLRELLGREPRLPAASTLAPVPIVGDPAKQAEALAAEVRKVLGNELEPMPSVRAAMRRLGVPTFLTHLGTPNVDGLTWRDESGRAAVAANVAARRAMLTAIRMTFAHELCHVLFDGTRLEPFGLVEKRSLADGSDKERRANAFAAHLLAPLPAVRAFLRERGLQPGQKPLANDVRALSEHFQMGVEAVAGHLVTAQLWDRRDMGSHWELATRRSNGEDDGELHPTEAEESIPLERRGELLDWATNALERGVISVGRWRELVGLRPAEDWRRVLDERQVARELEHRTPV